MYIMYMYVCTVYTPPIWKNGYAEYRSLKPNSNSIQIQLELQHCTK